MRPGCIRRFINSSLSFLAVAMMLMLAGGCSRQAGTPAQSSAPGDSEIVQVVGIGRIEPELKMVDLAGEVQGLVETISASPGDSLARGETIVQLRSDVEIARLAQAEARLEAQTALVNAARAQLAATEIKMQNARTNFQRIETLYRQGAVTTLSYDEAKTMYETLLQDVNRLQADVVSSQAVLKQAQADLRLAQALLDQKVIVAPADGILLSLDIAAGSMLHQGQAFGSFAIASPLTAWCEVDELYAARVAVSQRAFIRTEGMTDTLAVGSVIFAGPFLRKKSIFSDDVGALEDRRVREVRILLEPRTPLLYGQRIECVIQVDADR